MALTVNTSKDNQWRECVNTLKGLTQEWIVSLIEQGECGAFAAGERRCLYVLPSRCPHGWRGFCEQRDAWRVWDA